MKVALFLFLSELLLFHQNIIHFILINQILNFIDFYIVCKSQLIKRFIANYALPSFIQYPNSYSNYLSEPASALFSFTSPRFNSVDIYALSQNQNKKMNHQIYGRSSYVHTLLELN